MSRSYRKFHDGYLFHSVTVSGFNKGIHKDKKYNNRKLRRKANILLRYYDDNTIIPVKLDEVMERWSYIDDGKTKCHKNDIGDEYWKLIGK